MFSIGAVLKQTPVAISTAVIATVNFLIVAGYVTMEAAAVAALDTALMAVLGLFVATAARANVQDEVLKGIDLGRQLTATEPVEVVRPTRKKPSA